MALGRSLQTLNPQTNLSLSQDEPAYCGLATLAMVLNSLSIGESSHRVAIPFHFEGFKT